MGLEKRPQFVWIFPLNECKIPFLKPPGSPHFSQLVAFLSYWLSKSRLHWNFIITLCRIDSRSRLTLY